MERIHIVSVVRREQTYARKARPSLFEKKINKFKDVLQKTRENRTPFHFFKNVFRFRNGAYCVRLYYYSVLELVYFGSRVLFNPFKQTQTPSSLRWLRFFIRCVFWKSFLYNFYLLVSLIVVKMLKYIISKIKKVNIPLFINVSVSNLCWFANSLVLWPIFFYWEHTCANLTGNM